MTGRENDGPAGTEGLSRSIVEQLAEHIGQAIIEAQYRPGERLKEVELAQQYRVSRAPVREALRLLAARGLVDILPQRGARVTDLTPEEVDDLFEIRAFLVGLAARRAAAARHRELVARMRAGVAEMAEIGDDPAAQSRHARLSHRLSVLLTTGVGNRRLADLILSFAQQTARYMYMSMASPARRQRSMRNWRALCDAIEGGDQQQAELLARRLAEETRETARDAVRQRRGT